MTDLGAWRAAPSWNPANSRSQLIEPRKWGSDALIIACSLALVSLVATVAYQTHPSQTEKKDSSPKPLPAQFSK